jgi:hypothetical protein
MSRNPTPHHLLFIAKAALELAKAASSRAIQDYNVARDRNEMLLWAWRLRQFLDQFWGHDPLAELTGVAGSRRKVREPEPDRWSLPDAALAGWSPTIRRRVSDIYDCFYYAWGDFERQCAQHLDHPLMTTWFRPVTPTESPGTTATLATPSQVLLDSRGTRERNRYFTRDHRPDWDISQEAKIKCLCGEIADRICSAFENRHTQDDLFRGALSLERNILEQLMPHLFEPRELDSADEDANHSPLSLDDKACGVWSRLALEDKAPTTAEVARRIGCARASLYRCLNFRKLVEADQRRANGRKREMPKGWRDHETGRVEASIERPRPARFGTFNEDD